MPQLHARVGPEPLARLAACAVLVAFGWSAGAAETQRPARVRLPEPPPEAAPDELFAYVEDIADPALEPESRGRLRYHRRKVAALTVADRSLLLSKRKPKPAQALTRFCSSSRPPPTLPGQIIGRGRRLRGAGKPSP